MKKIVFTLLLLVGVAFSSTAQKYAFVDTKYILENIPEYKTAQKQLDDQAEQWQKEIEAKYQEIEKKYKAFQQEQILLPEETKRQRQEEIIELERKAKSLQKKYFGVEGELFKKREELIEPIQDKIYKAIKAMAKDKDYDFVLDKGKNSNILFANPKYDKSDVILKKLGYK